MTKIQSDGFIAIFLQRPVLASVLSLLIVVSGLAAVSAIEIRELPDVDRPVVTIDTDYPGATPEAMDAQVTAIVESAVAQVDGVRSISSSSSYARSRITAEFSSSVDINIASTDVKNAISAIRRDLPTDVEESRVVKADSESSPIIRLAISADAMDAGDLADLVDDVIIPRLQAVEGVAQADDYGVRNRVIRVRVVPVSLASRGYSIDDVARLLATATQNTPSGRIRNDKQQLLIRTEADAVLPKEIGALKLDEYTRLSDVAVVEWGFEDETTTSRVNGKPGIGVGIVRQAQSNTLLVAKRTREAVAELQRELPESIEIIVAVDDSIFIQEAVREVIKALFLSAIIVASVIFLFLRSARVTLIPVVTIPVSLLGTVALLWLAGFSINLITLLALVMGTGLVVDDAIVVTENIQRWRMKGAGPRAAAIKGTREIFFAVMATTATLAAVFVPISFLPGETGKLFSEFGFCLAFAVAVSSFVALTLCPVLSVKFNASAIHTPDRNKRRTPLLTGFYGRAVGVTLNHPALTVLACCIFAAGALVVYSELPKEITPKEDRGRVAMRISAQEGAGFEYLDSKVIEIENRLEPLIETGDVSNIQSINGIGGGSRSGLFVRLPPWRERTNTQEVMEERVLNLIRDIPGVTIRMWGGSSLGIRGAGQGLQFAVVGDDYYKTAQAAEEIAAALSEDPLFQDARPNFQTSQPQVSVKVNRETANTLGIPLSTIATTIQASADEYKASEIFLGDDIIDVLLTSSGEPINDPTDLENIFLITGSGETVPLSSVANVDETAVAANLSREQRRRAIPVSATLAPKTKMGEAINALRIVASEKLDGSLSITLLGEARLLETTNNGYLIVLGVASLIVLLVLAAQFESYISALILMFTAPFGLAAAVYAIFLSGGSINLYSQIGLVLLVGIMSKNGILIVEFANQLRDQGASVRDAIEEAAVTRFRPVLMTAISTFLGGTPLILGSGAGAESRQALGWVVVGGLGFATLFTLFLTPVAYVLLARFSRSRASEAAIVHEEMANAPIR